MLASDEQSNRFDLERRLLEKPHRLSCTHIAPMLMNRNAQVLAEAPAKCSGVDVEFPCEANDRQRTRPVRRNPAASLLMNRVLKEVAPAVDERVAGVLKISSGREVRWPSCNQQSRPRSRTASSTPRRPSHVSS